MPKTINWNTLNAQVKRELKQEKQQRIDQFALRVLPSVFEEFDENYDTMAKHCYNIAKAMEAERTRLMNED